VRPAPSSTAKADVPCSALNSARNPNQIKKWTPARQMNFSIIGFRATTLPMPNIPAQISTASQIKQVTAVKKIWLRRIRWRNTKLVCAPIATIKLAQVRKPIKNIILDWNIAGQFKIVNCLVNIA